MQFVLFKTRLNHSTYTDKMVLASAALMLSAFTWE